MSDKPKSMPVSNKSVRGVTKGNKTGVKPQPVVRAPTTRTNQHDRIWKIMKM